MLKWIIGVAVLVGVGLVGYDYFKGGFHTRPEMPEGAFSLSYKSGLRAIVVGMPDMRPERKYLGIPFKVPSWYEAAWSFCSAPSPDEKAKSQDLGPGSRLEAICRIKTDDTEVLMGAIYSVPNL